MRTTRILLLMGVIVLAPAAGWLPAQEGAELSRLRQEVDTLRYRLDFETRQLQQQADRFETRLARLEVDAGMPAPAPWPVSPRPAPQATTAGELAARRVVVEDAEGRIRAVLGVSDIYGPMLGLLDADGGLRALLSQDGPGSAGLRILDAAGVIRARLSLEDGEARLRLYDEDGGELPQAPGGPVPDRRR